MLILNRLKNLRGGGGRLPVYVCGAKEPANLRVNVDTNNNNNNSNDNNNNSNNKNNNNNNNNLIIAIFIDKIRKCYKAVIRLCFQTFLIIY